MHDTFPGEVLLQLAADAIEEAGATRERPLEFEGIRKRHLPEDRAHTKAQHHKAEYALRAAAMIRAGVDPGLLDEVIGWRTDDLWFWALEGLVIYVRAAAERTAAPVAALWADRQPPRCPPRSGDLGAAQITRPPGHRTRGHKWRTQSEPAIWRRSTTSAAAPESVGHAGRATRRPAAPGSVAGRVEIRYVSRRVTHGTPAGEPRRSAW